MMAVLDEEGLVAAGDDIDNRIADAQDVKTGSLGIPSLQPAVGCAAGPLLAGFRSGCKTPPKVRAEMPRHHVFPDGSASRRLSS
jgi:hypothetical protein